MVEFHVSPQLVHDSMFLQPVASTDLQPHFARVISNDYQSVEPDNRGYYTNRNARNYNLLLPHAEGQPLLTYLQTRHTNSSHPLSVLDVGCGQGIALAEMMRDYNIQASGVTATDLRKYVDPALRLRPFLEQIDLRIGDLSNLKDYFGGKRFDLIISVKTFEHVPNPSTIIKQCEELLKPGGVGLIENNGDKAILHHSPSLLFQT